MKVTADPRCAASPFVRVVSIPPRVYRHVVVGVLAEELADSVFETQSAHQSRVTR
jgi:hypothetical protein